MLEQEFSGGRVPRPCGDRRRRRDVRRPVQEGVRPLELRATLRTRLRSASRQIETEREPGPVLISVPMAGDPEATDRARDAVRRTAERHDPGGSFDGVDANVLVTGTPPAGTRTSTMSIRNYAPYVFAFVLGLSFLLLMVVFRSIVVPVKALIMNLLTVGAAYGMLVLVFQKGVGADLLGFQQRTNDRGRGCRCSCSPCCSGCRWTTTCSC